MGNFKKNTYDIILLVLGNTIIALAATFFILPNNILSGGVSGVAVALSPFIHVSKETIINGIYFFTFFLGLFFLGKDFAIKTLASSIMSPMMISALSQIEYVPNVDPILASLFGGLTMGLGLGITFKTGASTGGMDVPPLILTKYTGIKLSLWIGLIDAVTVLLGLKTYGINSVLMGFISVFACAIAIDKVQMLSGDQAKQVFIITSKIDEVLMKIHLNLNRGSTKIPIKGGFTNESRDMIMTVMMREQYDILEKMVKEIDPDAFLIVSDVTEVHGSGFLKSNHIV